MSGAFLAFKRLNWHPQPGAGLEPAGAQNLQKKVRNQLVWVGLPPLEGHNYIPPEKPLVPTHNTHTHPPTFLPPH